MSVTVIKTSEPNYNYGSSTKSVDIEEIDQSVEYESNFVPSYEWDISYYSPTGSATGPAGEDGSDGRGISSITFKSDSDGNDTPGDPGTTDTYEIEYTDGTTTTFDVTNGSDGTGITGTSFTSDDDGNGSPGDPGTVDTYTMSYSDGGSDTFTVQNGYNGVNGNSITSDSGAPSDSMGINGDLYIDDTNWDLYEKASGTWSTIGNIKGATGDTGPAGTSIDWLADSSTAPTSPTENQAYYNTSDDKSYIYNGTAWQTVVEDGIDGDRWKYGSGAPTDSTSREYNVYYINTNTNEVHYKSSGSTSWSLISTLTGALYHTTSSDSINLDTISVGSTITVNIADSGMSYSEGQVIVVAYNNSNRFYAEVDSYSDGTTIDLTITHKRGSGSYSSWDLNLSGVPYSQDETSSGQVFEVELDAGTTVSGRLSLTPTKPTGWSLSDGSGGGVTQDDPDDLIINHDVTDSSGNYRPCLDARVMYKSGSSPNIYVSLVGDASYTKLANDITNGKIELASLTSENYLIKIHLIFK